MLRLHDLDTNQTTELTELPRLSPTQLLLLPEESLEDLETIKANWTQDFPGVSPLFTRLRNRVILADWNQRRLTAALNQQQLEQLATGLPLHRWSQAHHESYKTLQHQQEIADRHFSRALADLQSAQQAQLSRAKAKPAPEPVKEPYIALPMDVRQFIEVAVVDGKTVTITDLTATEALEGRPWPEGSRFYREFYFAKSHVPEEYAWVLTHDGITHQPSELVTIYYSQPEFFRLCQLELDTASEFLLDGERLKYKILE